MSERPSEDELLEHVDFMHLPIGVYVVDPDGRFRACNDGVRAILGLPTSGPACTRIQDYYADPARFSELTTAALEAESSSNGFEKALVHLVVAGRDVYVEDYLKPLRHTDSGEIAGYLGCMAEVTEDHKAAQRSEGLQSKVEELIFDIGRILHANTSTLVMVNQTLDACAVALDTNMLGHDVRHPPPPHETDRLIQQKAAKLASAIERLMDAGDAERRKAALNAGQWETIGSSISLLREYQDRIVVKEMWNSTLRNIAASVVAACRSIEGGRLPREAVRNALHQALDLQRMTCLLDVVTTKATVAQMDYTLRALRDFVTAEVRVHEKQQWLALDDLVSEAVTQLSDFAQASNVDIVWRDRAPGVEIFGLERDLLRALSNVLHNAIKYSWQRDRSSTPWVAIKTGRAGDSAYVDFESWGVPITPDELERGLIFEIGYRGQWSTDRGRLGTGIGLTDAQRAAQSHGGEIEVTSRPATDSGIAPDHPDYYQRPFLTTVKIILPLSNTEQT